MNKPYWVEAKRAVKDHTKVIGYTVWRATDASGRYGECVHVFAVRLGRNPTPPEVALYLANLMRDDLNAGIE